MEGRLGKKYHLAAAGLPGGKSCRRLAAPFLLTDQMRVIEWQHRLRMADISTP